MLFMKTRFLYSLPLVLFIMSCDDSAEGVLSGFVSGENAVFEIGHEGGDICSVEFETTGAWYVLVNYKSDDIDWIDVSPEMGNAGRNVLSIQVHKNATEVDREADIAVKCGNNELVYTVMQGHEEKEEPPVVPEGGLDLIESVVINNYKPYNILVGTVEVDFDYDDDLLIASAVIKKDGVENIVGLSYGSGFIEYVYSEPVEATLKGGLINVLAGTELTYYDSRLKSFGDFAVTWRGDNISALSGGNFLINVASDEKYRMSGNLYLDLMLVCASIHENVEDLLPVLQTGYLGIPSASMPSAITVNGVRYMYIYALDGNGRIVEIHEFEDTDIDLSSIPIHRIYYISYLYR